MTPVSSVPAMTAARVPAVMVRATLGGAVTVSGVLSLRTLLLAPYRGGAG
jgi:hypothetical protein